MGCFISWRTELREMEEQSPGEAFRLVWICLTPRAKQGAWAVRGFSIQHCCQSQEQAAMHKEYKTET